MQTYEETFKKETDNCVAVMEEALAKKDFKTYYAAKAMLDESIEGYKREKALERELDTTNFGLLHYIFETSLPELIKRDKKVIRKVIKLIKEDKNLLSQFKFYQAVRGYGGVKGDLMNTNDVVSMLGETVNDVIDKDTVLRSNAKFKAIMKEHHIYPSEFIPKEIKDLYEACNYVLTVKKSPENAVRLVECRGTIADYMDKHKADYIKEEKDPLKLLEEFEKKVSENLNESEVEILKTLTESKESQKKEDLFNMFKNECLDKINEMLKENKDNDDLASLKKTLEDKTFCEETIIKDIAKLLEIREILSDN